MVGAVAIRITAGLCATSRKAHDDVETAFGLSAGGQGCIVGMGDSSDDR
jgi:hypothetical protein